MVVNFLFCEKQKNASNLLISKVCWHLKFKASNIKIKIIFKNVFCIIIYFRTHINNIYLKQKSSIFFEKHNSLNKLTIKYCKTSNLETLIKMSFQGLCKFLLPLCRNSHNTVWNNRKSL